MRTRQETIFYYTVFPFKRKIDEMRQVTEKVAHILANYEFTRDSDQALIFQYWIEADKVTSPSMQNRHLLTAAESITRARRKIQNDYNLYLPNSEEVRQLRKISEEAVKSWAIESNLIQEKTMNNG